MHWPLRKLNRFVLAYRQKERERKIRTELQHPSTMLPCSNLNNSCLSKKEIPESTISHIKQLPENSRKAYLQKGLKTGGLRVSLQDNNALSLSQSSFGVADQQNDTALKSSEDSSSPCSTPEITIDETLPACSFSPISEPISELSCHGSVERERRAPQNLCNVATMRHLSITSRDQWMPSCYTVSSTAGFSMHCTLAEIIERSAQFLVNIGGKWNLNRRSHTRRKLQ